LPSYFLFDKIQNGGRRHAEIYIYGRNSVTVARNLAHTQNERDKPNFSLESLT